MKSLVFALLFACGATSDAQMRVTSADFQEGGEIPKALTCEGGDRAPELSWVDPPAGTKTFALIIDDPDAPDPAAPKMTWVHWVLYNIPSGVRSIPSGGEPLPTGTSVARNDWRKQAYGGPCPPIGTHRYRHRIFALDTVLPDLGAATHAHVEAAMKGHVLAEAVLTGTYEKEHAGRRLE